MDPKAKIDQLFMFEKLQPFYNVYLRKFKRH